MWRSHRTSAPTLEPVVETDWREHPAALLGMKDAVDVLAGERVVRAILAHYAVPTFAQIWPDLDWKIYRDGYAAVPNAKPPLDRRQVTPTDGYEGPRRRAEDTY